MLYACIVFPQLALDAVQRRREDTASALALVDGPATLRKVIAANAAAISAGVRAGQRLAAARALCDGLQIVDVQAADTEHWHRFLAAWAYRHSSLVSMQWPDAIVLEARASFRLFGPWPRFERRLREELRLLGFSHRITLAPTPRAAWWLAGVHDGLAVDASAPMRRVLDGVPLRAAPLPPDVASQLQQMGIRTLGQLRTLPRAGLRRRFGHALCQQLDAAYGDGDDPLQLYQPPECFDARVELGHETIHQQALLFPLKRLLGDLATFLSIRDGGVQQFQLLLEHERHGFVGEKTPQATCVDIRLLAAERDPQLLLELARNRLERVQVPRAVVAMRLLAQSLPPFIPTCRDLFDPRPQQAQAWEHLHERLRARLGDAAVYGLQTTPDPRPEYAWRRACDGTHAPAWAVQGDPPQRPAWLLPQPRPLRDHGMRLLCGPERLESGWWDGGDVRRDYYIAQLSTGQRAWVFAAAGEREGWMLHGLFA